MSARAKGLANTARGWSGWVGQEWGDMKRGGGLCQTSVPRGQGLWSPEEPGDFLFVGLVALLKRV